MIPVPIWVMLFCRIFGFLSDPCHWGRYYEGYVLHIYGGKKITDVFFKLFYFMTGLLVVQVVPTCLFVSSVDLSISSFA